MFQPVNMRTRHTSDGKIAFFWGAFHDHGGKKQSAYRLTAGKTDTGWVESEEQFAILRLPEKAGTGIRWTLELRDEQGETSEKGESAFTVWHLDKFHGAWIADPASEASCVSLFRKRFHADRKPDEAFLFLSAAGIAEARLNRKRVGDRLLAPNLSHFEKRRFYEAYPVEITAGENDLTVALGDGWRRNLSGYLNAEQRKAVTFFGTPELRAFLLMRFGDREEIVETDGSWQVGRGKTFFSHLFDGESYDDRIGETFTGYAATVSESRPEPIYDYLEPIRVQESYLARSVTRKTDGAYLLDFGQNMQGFLSLHVSASQPAGSEIVIRHAEELDEEGGLYTAPLRTAKATDRVVASGRDFVWEPRFTYHGFRYAEIRGWHGPLAREDVSAKAIATDIRNASSFESGSALLNAVQKNVVMTERSNLIGIATDCPQRDERMGWMNDATVRFEETPYNFSVASLFPKIDDDLKDEQGADGAITCTAPLVYGNRPADPVCSSFLVAGWQNWLHNGDRETLKRNYGAYKAWSDCLEAHSEGHIVDYSYYGDWAGPKYACEGDDGARSIVTDGRLMSTGYHYYNAKLLSRMAAVLGDREEAELQKNRAEAIRKAFLDRWYDPEKRTLSNDSEGEIAFALWLGILPEEARQGFAKKLRDDLAGREYKFTTGNLTTVYMLKMLSEYGYVDDAYALMTREEYPGYGFMIQNAATTVWERFELKKNPGMNSHNHPMYGSVGAWFYSHLAGLAPTEGGWSRFTFKPYMPKKLLYASASVDTPKGEISARWHKKYGKIYVELSLPFGTEADVELEGVKETAGAGEHRYILDGNPD